MHGDEKVDADANGIRTKNKIPPTTPLLLNFFFVFVALRPISTAMVIAGRSVHLTTLFPGQA